MDSLASEYDPALASFKTLSHAGPELPKGGGATSPITQQFKSNPATGTASLSIPLPLAVGRGLAPSLGLSYDSGNGAGVFGLGWSLGQPSVRRRTDKRLPEYVDARDRFLLSGADELVVAVDADGDPQRRVETEQGTSYEVTAYRPRSEQAFSKIEMWRNSATGESHWRVRSGDNTLTVFGSEVLSRVHDPEDPSRIAQWLVDYSRDSKGNIIRYLYKAEDSHGVDFSHPAEQHRKGKGNAARYLKTILYGNRTPWFSHPNALPEPDNFLFKVVLDYGEFDPEESDPTHEGNWTVRPDPLSTYRQGFEVRTWRQCHNVLVFHCFDELGVGPTLVSRMAVSYGASANGSSLLTGLIFYGYKRGTAGEYSDPEELPTHIFGYAGHDWHTGWDPLRNPHGEDLESEIAESRNRWTDLYAEGLPGLLHMGDETLTYRRNLGGGRLSAPYALGSAPQAGREHDGALDVLDLEGNGTRQLVARGGDPGFWEIGDGVPHGLRTPFRLCPTSRSMLRRALSSTSTATVAVTCCSTPKVGFYGTAARAGKAMRPAGMCLRIRMAHSRPVCCTGGLTSCWRLPTCPVTAWPTSCASEMARSVTGPISAMAASVPRCGWPVDP